MPGSRSQQDQKPTATIEVGHNLSRASLGELQQELQVRIKDLQSRREALVRELQEVDEKLLAHTGGPGGEEAHRAMQSGYRRVQQRIQNEQCLAEALVEVLSAETLSVTAAAAAVQAHGYQTTSPNFRTIVNQTLIAHPDRFERVRRGHYTATGSPD